MGIIKPKRPVALYTVLAALGVSVLVYGKLRLDARNQLLKDAESADPKVIPNYRPPVKPELPSWQPKVERVRLPSYQVADMTDNGVFLLATNNPVAGPKKEDDPLKGLKSYQLYANGVQARIDMKSNSGEVALSPTGEIKTFSSMYQYYWASHYEQKGAMAMDATAIRRTMKDGSKIYVENGRISVRKGNVSTVLALAQLSKESSGHVSLPSVLSLVEHGDDDSIWIYENAGKTEMDLKPRLTRIQGSKKTEFPLPFRETYVQSLAQTGETIVATLGSLVDKEPYRAYQWTDKKWVELPIPDGYTYSLVKKVTFDGLIIGVVRDLGLKTMPVVWKGNQCFPLQNAPEWPKYEMGTQIIAVARNGNIYVQPNYDKAPGTGLPNLDLTQNSYVMNVKG